MERHRAATGEFGRNVLWRGSRSVGDVGHCDPRNPEYIGDVAELVTHIILLG
jgi:hypothetical protein